MPKAVALPSGHTATVRTETEVKFKHRKQVLKALNISGDAAAGAASIDFGGAAADLEAALITVGVVSWDVEATDDQGNRLGEILLIPANSPTSLDEVSAQDAAALSAAVQPLRAVLFPDFSPSPDESSPTPPSGD